MARAVIRASGSRLSSKMRRYKDETFDLDLTYIYPNLIVMGFPAETTLESIVWNPMESVVRFLDERHKNHYKVYNLCKERTYQSSKFHNRVAHYPIAKDKPPSLELIKAFCDDVTDWLATSEEHVAVVHAVGNKVRTCIMVSCFLLHQRQFHKAEDAISYYSTASAPSKTDNFSLKAPSHGRFVKYYEGLISRDLEYKRHALLLTKIQIETIPRIASNTCIPSFSIYRDDVNIYKSSIKIGVKPSQGEITLGENLRVPICGNMRFEFYHRSGLGLNKKSIMFQAWVNSFFIANLIGDDAQLVEDDSGDIKDNQVIRITLKKSELDKAHQDKTNKFFSPNLKVHLYFSEMNNLMTPLPSQPAYIREDPFRRSEYFDIMNLPGDGEDSEDEALEDKDPLLELLEEEGKDHTPAEILARGPEALHAYREAIELGKKAVYRTRVMFVGQERVGKTSLSKRLMGKKFDANEISTDGIEASTNCRIDVHRTTSWMIHNIDTKDQHDMYTTAVAEHMARQLKERLNISQSEQLPDETLPSQEISIFEENQTPASRGPACSSQCTSDNTEEQSSETEQVEGDETEVDAGFSKRKEFRLSSSDSYNQDLSISEKKVLHVPDLVSKVLADKLEDEAEDDNDKEITFSLWDFAGQELYYTTHQVFLSSRTVFVVVVNLTDDFSQTTKDQTVLTALDRLDFWLQSIYTFTVSDVAHSRQAHDCDQLSPPIFIVGTHRNSLGDTEEERQQQVYNKFESIRQCFQGKCYREHVVNEYFDVENSLEGDERISELKRKMMEVMEKEPYMGEEIPLRWMQFEDSVKEAVRRGENTMSVDEVRQLPGASDIPAESTTEFDTMLQFYHDLGNIMYHPTAKSSLRSIVILNPHWLIDVFRKVITVLDRRKQRAVDMKLWDRLDNEGILEDKLINLMWHDFIGNDKQSKEKKSALLELMEKYDLLVEQCHPNLKQSERCYYVPSRLKKTDGDDDTGDQSSHSNSPASAILYVDFNGFLPVGFFHRIMARAVHWSQRQGGSEPKLLYRKATFYADDLHNFQLEMMPNQPSMIKVVISPEEVVGDKAASRDDVDPSVCNKVKHFLSNTFEDLKSTWASGITYKFCLACPCSSDALHFLDLDECTKPSGILQCLKRKSVSVKSFFQWFSPQHSDIKQEDPIEQVRETSGEATNLLKKYDLPSFLGGLQETYHNVPSPSIPFDIFTKLCTMLTPRHALGHDWRMLASKMGLNSYIEYLGSRFEEPTAVVLRYWMEKEKTVEELCDLLRSMSRGDVADELGQNTSR